MARKQGLSHALATLVCTLSAALMVYVIRDYLPIFNKMIIGLAKTIKDMVGISYSEELLGIIMLATILSFLWGIGYFHLHTDGD